uniref:Soluble scavenger receptor cysteine-rich domain-containing protein SSC5D n=1 Tax=Cairina moschata TaxID=8855 RepID=A0A8C3CI95_CAIMO
MPWLSWCCTEQTGALLGKVWPYWADWGHAGAVLGRLGLLWAGYAGVVQGLFWADGDCTGDTGTPFPMHPCCALPPTVPVRLVGGRSRCHGRVELLQDGAWGSICASGWDRAASRVLCRELGCGRPRLIPAPCSPPAADGPPVTLQRVQCSGQEPALAHCVLQPRDAPSCPSDRLAAVDCEEPFGLRLSGGPGRCAGRLEVQRNGSWGTVCDDGWSAANAAVVCQELGCREVPADLRGDRPRFGPGTGRIWLDDVRCRGQEGTLQDCAHRAWGYHDCTHDEDVGVVCQDP